MAQARARLSTRAIDSLSDSNPKTLADNQTIVQNEDGSVVLTTVVMKGERECVTSRRCDSDGDLDHRSKGGETWWSNLIADQKARDEKAEKAAAKTKAPKAPKTEKKEKSE